MSPRDTSLRIIAKHARNSLAGNLGVSVALCGTRLDVHVGRGLDARILADETAVPAAPRTKPSRPNPCAASAASPRRPVAITFSVAPPDSAGVVNRPHPRRAGRMRAACGALTTLTWMAR